MNWVLGKGESRPASAGGTRWRIGALAPNLLVGVGRTSALRDALQLLITRAPAARMFSAGPPRREAHERFTVRNRITQLAR